MPAKLPARHWCWRCGQRVGLAALVGAAAFVSLAGLAGPLRAQTGVPPAGTPSPDAAAMITPEVLESHLRVFTAESLQGRMTPSPSFDRAARYIASQFQRLGLTPAGDSGTWFQRYPLPLRIDFPRAQITFTAGGQTAVARLTTAARLEHWGGAPQAATQSVLLVAGRQTDDGLERIGLTEHDFVLYVPPPGSLGANDEFLDALRHRAAGVVVLTPDDVATCARAIAADTASRSVTRFESPMRSGRHPNRWQAVVCPAAVPGLPAVLAAAGLDWARVVADSQPVARHLPGLQLTFEMPLLRAGDDTATAINVVGVFSGRDSLVPGPRPGNGPEYVTFVAHLDQAPGLPGSPARGALDVDDNATGVAGLLALAQAFSRPEARPRRSLLFVATSGGRQPGAWGSQAFVETTDPNFLQLVRVWGIVLALNLDQIGRGPRDSVRVDGWEALDVKPQPAWIAAQHPELGLTVTEGGAIGQPESDTYPFVTSPFNIPSLSFQNGRHRDLLPGAGRPLDLAQAARIVRLAYYVGAVVADAAQRPQWNAEGRQQILGR